MSQVIDDSTPSQSSVSTQLPSVDILQHQSCVKQQAIVDDAPSQSNVSTLTPSIDNLQDQSYVEQVTEGSNKIKPNALAEHSVTSSRNSYPLATQHIRAKMPRAIETPCLKYQRSQSSTTLSLSRVILGRAKQIASNRFDSLSNWWLFETLSFIGSLGALLAIVIIFILHDGSSEQHWPGDITVNSVISWFTALMKAMMLVPIASCISQASWNRYHEKAQPLWDAAIFDSASRGPLGSMQLLLKFKPIEVASVGAFITILTLGTDPLVQQMVKTTSQALNSTETPSIGQALGYTSYNSALKSTSDFLDYPPIDIIGAIYAGIFMGTGSSNQEPAIRPICPTGNCTFPTYQSLAVCSACQDVNHAMAQTCFYDQYMYSDPLYVEHYPHRCTLSLPNGLKVNQTGPPTVASSGFLPLIDPPLYVNSFFNFTRILYSDSGTPLTNATQCTLSWCIKTYQSFVTNGRLIESSEDWRGGTDIADAPYIDDHGLHRKTLLIQQLPLNSSSAHSSNAIANTSGAPFSYPIDSRASGALTSFLANKLTLSKSAAIAWRDRINSTLSEADVDILSIMVNPTPSLDGLFANIATTLTLAVRSPANSQGNTDTFPSSVNGTSTHNPIMIQVRWGWIAFPATLVASTGALLAATIIQTRARGLPVWKSSLVPLAMGGLEEVPGQDQSNTMGMSRGENGRCHTTNPTDADVLRRAGGKIAAMERAARDVKVKMIELPEGKTQGDEEKART